MTNGYASQNSKFIKPFRQERFSQPKGIYVPLYENEFRRNMQE